MSESIDHEKMALASGAAAMDLALTDVQLSALIQYMDLLQKWGSVYNLTAVRTRAEMMATHILDCLAVVNPLRKQLNQAGLLADASLLDVGSGAGLPGIALAICLPQLQVSCIDTGAKKAAFVQQAGLQLGLKNLKAIHGRVEKHAPRYNVVSSRAFASLEDFVVLTRACLADQGIWMAMKGKTPHAELEVLQGVDVFHVEPLDVPNLNAERCVVWMRPSRISMQPA